MQTCCPYCDTAFRVPPELIQSLDARVRCGLCNTVFNARDELEVDESADAAHPPRLPQEENTEPRSRFDFDRVEDVGVEMDDTLRIDEDSAAMQAHAVESDIDGYGAIVLSSEDESALPQADIFAGFSPDSEAHDMGSDADPDDEPVPLFAPTPRKTSGRQRWWVIGSVLLVVLVAGQWGYASRDQLLESPGVRQVVASVCLVAGCELEPLRSLEQIELLRRSVYTHPNIEDALIISLAMVNNANFEQAFPALLIRMADVRGQVVAQRDFTPEEYLESGNIGMMPPGSPVTVTLEIHDPGNDALTFELEFR